MKKPELLAPVGNLKSLYAAIQAGCDAVYLSGKMYGARKFADNFTDLELIQAIKYSHLYGIKVYVTVNTLVYESEVENFVKYVEFLHKNNVDAIIIQDIGMFDLIRKLYPNLEIHISTQMNVHNIEGVKLFEQLGAKRVVLSRETSIELIDEIKKNSNIELEVFIHGALCISYSGQCLMSSLIGGRSGNRGTCAQCCRQPYDLYSNDIKINTEKYLLSTKDLNTLNYIDKLIDIGVDSLKIEGRMKRPEYVYYVVKLYRKAIDSYIETGKIDISLDDIDNLKKIFNRQFTKGFIFNEDNDKFTNEYRPNNLGLEIGRVLKYENKYVYIKLSRDISINDGIRILDNNDTGKIVDNIFIGKDKVKTGYANDVVKIPYQYNVSPGSLVVKTTDIKLLDKINEDILCKKRKIFINLKLSAKINENLILTIDDGFYKYTAESDYVVQISKKCPTTNENIKAQLSKLGDTIFEIKNIELDCDKNIFIPVKILNEIRRIATENLEDKRIYSIPFKRSQYTIELSDYNESNNKTIYVCSQDEYEQIKNSGYNNIYVDKNVLDKCKDDRFILKIPRVMEKLVDEDNLVLIGEYGSLYKYKNFITDFSFNVVNSYSVAFLHSMGAKRVTLSYELNDYQIVKIINNYKNRYHKNPCLEVIVSGKIESMVSKYNLLKKFNLNNENNFLVDKFGNKFLVKEKNNLMYIYHYKQKSVKNKENYYSIGISSIRDSF